MSGYLNSDGSGLVGGKLPGGTGEALNLDGNGNLLIAPGPPGTGAGNQPTNLAQINGIAPQMSGDDGAALNAMLELALTAYNSGGPVLASGVPSQLAFDRLRTWLGKGSQSSTITATSSGDTALTFSVAPKTVLPGQAIKLQGGATPEYVYVVDSYTPSASATSIPLKSPVVNAGQSSASWSVFSPAGPGNAAVPGEGIAMFQETLFDAATGNLYAKQGVRGIQDVSVGGRTSSAIAAGVAANTVIKATPGRLARILVTATGTNQMAIYDNATTNSGTIIAIVPANAVVGTLIDCQAIALNGITVAGNASNPGVTIFYY